VTARTAATRYARALFDVALKEKADFSRVQSELEQFDELIRGHETLERVLLNPAIPAPRKRMVVSELLARAQFLPIVSKLFALLAERDRLVLLPDLIEAYRQRLLDHLKVVRAEVTTALALPSERAQAIGHTLARATGRRISLSTRVDPAIIGGIVARIGSTVYDASVTSHLQRVKQRMIENV